MLRTVIVVTFLALPLLAQAQEGDGVYRRFDHWAQMEGTLGARLTLPSESSTVAGRAEVGMRFVGGSGPYVSADFNSEFADLALGISIRPLWPALFLLDRSQGRAFVDLLIESIALRMACVFGLNQQNARFRWGAEFEIPVWWRSDPAVAIRFAYEHTARRDGRSDEHAFIFALRAAFGVGASVSQSL